MICVAMIRKVFLSEVCFQWNMSKDLTISLSCYLRRVLHMASNQHPQQPWFTASEKEQGISRISETSWKMTEDSVVKRDRNRIDSKIVWGKSK